MPSLRVLYVEDRDDDAVMVLRELRKAGFDVDYTRVETEEAMRDALKTGEWDLVVSDFSMPRFSGPQALEVLKETGLDIPFVIVSGTVGEERAVAALKAGAHDFLSKQNLKRFVPAVTRELREATGRAERRKAEQKLQESEATQRQLEAQFRQAQKMEAVGRLAGSVAHDFNNILTAIEGYASLTLADMDPADAHYADVQEILNAAEWAASFTRQLLAFSRKGVTQPEYLEANAVLTALRSLLSRVIGQRHAVQLALSDQLGGIVIDRGQLEQIVMNLVVNARDAMEHGGTIVVQTARAATRPGSHVFGESSHTGPFTMIRVRDAGAGIAPELVSQIFEPFFTTKEAGKGTGLGLSTVYGIVTQNDGFISVRQNDSGGTDFDVYFPEHETPRPELRNGANASKQVVNRIAQRCLVVEDEGSIRNLMQRTLQRAGYSVLAAESSEAALELLADHNEIDVLITDLMLPDMNGVELIAKANEIAPNLRTLLISGYSASDIELPAEFAFLEKPFTPAELLAAIA